MKYPALLEAVIRQGFKIHGLAAFGVCGGYPVSVTQLNKNTAKVSISVHAAFQGNVKELRSRINEYGVVSGISGRLVTYDIRLRDMDMARFSGIMTAAVTVLKNYGLTPPDTCCLCGAPGADAYMAKNGAPMCFDAVHLKCVNDAGISARVKAASNPGNYFTGILGAFLGAVVGAIPAFIALNFLGIISAWLFLLLPVGAYYGYKLLKGKMNGVAIAASTVMSLIGLCVLIMAWDAAVNMDEWGLPLGEALKYTLYYTFVEFSVEYWSWLGANIVKILIFYLIGVAFSASLIRGTNKSALKSLEDIQKTIIVKNAPQNAASPAPEAQIGEND